MNDGSENVDLSAYEANLIPNSAAYTFTYFHTLADAQNYNNQIGNFTAYNLSNTNNTVGVRVTSSDGCWGVAELKFSFLDSPVIVMGSAFPLCEHKTVTIDAGPGFDGYLWLSGDTTQTTVIDQPGDYWVTVTEDHSTIVGNLTCSATKNFNIFLSNPATITKVKTIDWTDTYNMIGVYVEGLGDYEFSLDGIHYQDSSYFYDLPCGEYVVYVHDKFECGTVTQDVFLLMYPRYFTPNEDTYHDFWKVKFSEDEPGMTTDIFDRDGKLITKLQYKEGWDGKFNGEMLPSNDYWFVVTRATGKQYRGHFTLKR